MVLRMINFLIFWGFTEKFNFQGGSPKTNIEEGRDCLKREDTWTVCRFKGGGLGKKEGGVDTPMPTMIFRCRHQVVRFPVQFQPSELSTQDSIEVIQTFIFLSQIETLLLESSHQRRSVKKDVRNGKTPGPECLF